MNDDSSPISNDEVSWTSRGEKTNKSSTIKINIQWQTHYVYNHVNMWHVECTVIYILPRHLEKEKETNSILSLQPRRTQYKTCWVQYSRWSIAEKEMVYIHCKDYHHFSSLGDIIGRFLDSGFLVVDILHMRIIRRFLSIRLFANGAAIRTLSSVDPHVDIEIVAHGEPLPANLA